jgi:ribosomal protein S18 acetylase RimI-like enzyme
MSEIVIRNAAQDEPTIIVRMIRLMVTDMESYGGYAAATDDSAWEKLATEIAEELNDENFKYLIAQANDGEIAALAGAKLVILSGAFAPRRTVHISVVYVRPQFRRRGIGNALTERMLEWAASVGAAECDLNVLMNNPAKSLYCKHGFSSHQIKMVRSLTK